MRIRVDFEIPDDVAAHHWRTNTREGFRSYLVEHTSELIADLAHSFDIDRANHAAHRELTDAESHGRTTAPLAALTLDANPEDPE